MCGIHLNNSGSNPEAPAAVVTRAKSLSISVLLTGKATIYLFSVISSSILFDIV